MIVSVGMHQSLAWRRAWTLLAAMMVLLGAALPGATARAVEASAAPALPYVIGAADGSGFLAELPVGAKAVRFVFFGAGVATASVTVTVPSTSQSVIHINHNFPAMLYAHATPLGVMNGQMGLNATLTPRGFVGPVKVSVGVPGGDDAELIVSHFVLNGPMKLANPRQAQLVAGAVEMTMFEQHWPVLYFWSTAAVRAASTEAAFGARLARLFAAKAGTVQVTKAGPAGQIQQQNGVSYYEDPVSISYEQSGTVNGTPSARGVTLSCHVRLAWDGGAWRYDGLPCAPAVYTAWFPRH